MIFDTVPANNELDMLECRLFELESVPDLVTVVVEAEVTHQDRPKPFWITENLSRFEPWKDRLYVVQAKGLPTAEQDPDPWARERAQREFAAEALVALGAHNDDVVLHGDLDEIPTALVARNVRPRGMVALEQRAHFWAVDWLWPQPWRGTVATTAGNLKSFNTMRDSRNYAAAIHDAGWHLSWLGGPDVAMEKVGAFCHPEVRDRIVNGLAADTFLREGIHVDGVKMLPVDVDATWPRYVYERRCPENWFRSRPK